MRRVEFLSFFVDLWVFILSVVICMCSWIGWTLHKSKSFTQCYGMHVLTAMKQTYLIVVMVTKTLLALFGGNGTIHPRVSFKEYLLNLCYS